MNREDLRKKIAKQWGTLSDEAAVFREMKKNADKWEKHEYEKWALGKEGPSGSQSPERAPRLPADREIMRATFTYFFARAAWIIAMWVILLLVMSLIFGGLFLALDGPDWGSIKTVDHFPYR